MEAYKKPIVLVNEELAEGVYAASGDEAGSDFGTGSGVSVTSVKLTNEGNEWNKVNTYTVTIKNNGSAEATDWSVSVSVISGTASSAVTYNSWLASVTLSGNTITIVPGGGGAIPAGAMIDVEVVVSYSSDSITVG